jgi:glucose/arabinose dehydrogenase
MKNIPLLTFFLCSIILGCKSDEKEIDDNTQNNSPNSELSPKISTETIFSGRGIIWGFEFLENNKIIFTEKTGKINLWENGVFTEISGFPDLIHSSGQGGLLDICLHPEYKNNGWIYVTYNQNESNGSKLSLSRFKIAGNKIVNFENLFNTSATNKWKGHNGSRLTFDKDGFMFLSVGEGGSGSYGGASASNQNSQNIKEAWGKVHRFKENGDIPSDNPIFEGETKATSLYSIGHRNPQGMTLNTETGKIWVNEHGPKGGDELNQIIKGANYGWPKFSMGVNYDGSKISDSHTAQGITQPNHFWTPSIGASGLEYVSSTKYGNWKGSYLSGGLALQHLARVKFDEKNKAETETLLKNIGRIRDVKQSPDGFIYISVENPGRIIKLVPTF